MWEGKRDRDALLAKFQKARRAGETSKNNASLFEQTDEGNNKREMRANLPNRFCSCGFDEDRERDKSCACV